MSKPRSKVTHLVVDAGAFIQNSPINDIGDQIYTLPEVVKEIKDENTRNRLQFIPYEIKYREPSTEDMKFIINFSKKTGDFSRLSVTDLRIMALTYRLELEMNGHDHLRSEPIHVKVNEKQGVVELNSSSHDNVGFYQDKKQEDKINVDHSLDNLNNEQIKIGEVNESKDECVQKEETNQLEDDEDENEDEDEDGDEDEEDDDEAGWITPSNIQSVKDKMNGLKLGEEQPQEALSVACITGDFAMQNVLLQIGLKVISPKDGLCIRETKQFVLRCYACGKLAKDINSNSQFCFHCGNAKTLKRVSIRTREDGTQHIHINFKKPINIRGTRYSLPLFKGGKHSNNPILVPDQPLPQQRKTKFAIEEKMSCKAEKVLSDPDYITRANPFAVNDVYSTSSRVTSHLRNVRNPNASRKPTGNKKRNNK